MGAYYVPGIIPAVQRGIIILILQARTIRPPKESSNLPKAKPINLLSYWVGILGFHLWPRYHHMATFSLHRRMTPKIESSIRIMVETQCQIPQDLIHSVIP